MGAQKCVSNSAVVPNVCKRMFSRAWQGARVALLSSDNYSPNPRKRNEEEETASERRLDLDLCQRNVEREEGGRTGEQELSGFPADLPPSIPHSVDKLR